MIRRYVLFDSTLRTRRGKTVPYWDTVIMEREIIHGELVWFHESYGLMKLYRLHDVDGETFIAESMGVSCLTDSDMWSIYSANPALALKKGA